MAVKHKKYVLKTNPTEFVRAIKVTERNYLEIAKWCGGQNREDIKTVNGETDISNHRVAVKTPAGLRVAKVGEFVFKPVDAKDSWYVGKDEFLTKFELVGK